MKKIFFAFVMASILSAPAHALFEIRAGYGVNTPGEDTLTANSALNTVQGFNLDALIEIPLVPVGLGLRYETMEFSVVRNSNSNLDSDFSRLSLMANYRFIDFFFYLGVIGTVGIVNEITYSVPNQANAEYSKDLTFTAGVEGGVSLGLFQVGAELGYMLGGEYDIDSQPAAIGAPNLDGIYAKILVGVGF